MTEDAPTAWEESPPISAYTDEPRAKMNGRAQPAQRVEHHAELDWTALETREPPPRVWAIDHWLGMGHVTLFAGAGGTGKTGMAQAMGSCLALRREYLDWMSQERTVLIWASEDDEAGLWRRQIAIARWLEVPLSAFASRLHVVSYDGEDVELAALLDQRRLIGTPMMAQLREQIGDYRADVVMIDNIARVYGGNENDRHQVSTFVAMLRAAGASTDAAVLLLGHPGKGAGSEYSGSTAWEGAVRSRLYLGRTLPDVPQSEDEPPEDDTVRYLCRRKANYSTRDWRRIHYRDGVMVPEISEPSMVSTSASPTYARDVVARAVRRLADMGEHGVAATGSSKYLPRLARDYKLLETISERQFAVAMRAMRTDGALTVATVGTYANRTPRQGLVLAGSGT